MALAAAVALALLLAAEARALVDGVDRQVTFTEPLDNAAKVALSPAVARNTRTGDFLVVYRAIAGAATEQQVFAQRLGPDGAPVGPRLTIGPSSAVDPDPFLVFPEPRVAYSETSDRWLIVFSVDDQLSGRPNDKFEVFARSVSGAGAMGTTQRISVTGNNVAADSARHPDVAWNPDRDEFLVTWDTAPTSSVDNRLWVRRTTATGTPIGSAVDVSGIGAVHGGVWPSQRPSLAYDTTAGRWLVTWYGDPDATNGLAEQEVFGRLVSGLAVPEGLIFRVTVTGAEADTNAHAGFPAPGGSNPPARAVHSPRTNAFLVSYWGNPGAATGLHPLKYEVFAQRLTPTGARVGDGVRVSETGLAADVSRSAAASDIALDPLSGEAVVVWADDDPDVGLTDDETEISGQRIGRDLVPVGTDFRIGQTGEDGVASGVANRPVVTAAAPGTYLVAWDGRPDYFKTEISSDVLRLPALSLPATATVAESAGALSLPVTVTDADPAGVPITADGVATSNTATLGADFLAPGPLTLPPLAGAGSLVVPIVDDALVEGAESFTASMSEPVGAVLGSATTTVTITDDDVAPAPAPGPSGGPPTPPPGSPTEARAPAKLQVARARVRGGRLDVLGTITARATGSLRVTYRAAGRVARFTIPIGSGGRVRIDRPLTGAQRRRPTGIVEIAYAGNARVRPDEVRLRAASGRALLTRAVTRIRSRRLEVNGTVSRRARGLVRIRLAYLDTDGDVTELQYRARIVVPRRAGPARWSIASLLPARAAAMGGQVDIQFTGYEPGRIRGEQISKQVDP